jgi:putative transposase
VPRHNTVFRQITQFIPWGTLDRLIVETRADKGVSQLDTKGQLLAMIFAQLSGARGLRDIVTLLESHAARRYHAGLPRGRRSTLADANKKRPA